MAAESGQPLNDTFSNVHLRESLNVYTVPKFYLEIWGFEVFLKSFSFLVRLLEQDAGLPNPPTDCHVVRWALY